MRIWRFLLWAVVFAITLIWVSEWYLSRQGFAVENADGCRQYSMYDSYLGWVTRPGRNPSTEHFLKKKVYETVWSDTSRASRAHRHKKFSKRVLILGCSHTYGLGVPDEATFVAQLNKRFPDVCFDNFGVPGYGTYQCYLREKQQLLMHPDYDAVLYCAVSDHFNRNTDWNCLVGSLAKNCYYALNPRADLDARGKLRFYEPLRRWPGDNLLISINFAKRVYYSLLIAQSEQAQKQNAQVHELYDLEKVAVFWELNRRMAEHAESYGAKYGLVGHQR